MSQTEGTRLTQLEQEEILQDYASVAEESRYPPFSVPLGKKEKDFLLNLSREFDSFVLGQKPYDSFDAVQQEYSEELIESRAWRSLGYSPKEAAIEVLSRALKDSGVDESKIKLKADYQFDLYAKVYQIFAEEFVPWEIL